jgi:arsenate reductase
MYRKPTWTTCRQVYAILKEAGVDIRSVDYFIDPKAKKKFKELLRKMGLKPRDVLRTKESIDKTLGLASGTHGDDEIVDLLLRHPNLLQRPIVENGDRAVLARPAERIRELL